MSATDDVDAGPAEAFAAVLHGEQEWQLRKVESRAFMSGSYSVVRVSIDCVPQPLRGLRYPAEGGPDDAARLIVPLTFMEKGTLKGFDLTDGSGRPAPVLGRSEYADLLVDTVLVEINRTDSAYPAREGYS